MGWLYPQYVIGQVYQGDDWLDKLCEESGGMIVRVDGKANGEINYFMGWDGSKEGWNTSDEYDKLRDRFLNRLKKIDARWYAIDDDHEHGLGVAVVTYMNPKKVAWSSYDDEIPILTEVEQ